MWIPKLDQSLLSVHTKQADYPVFTFFIKGEIGCEDSTIVLQALHLFLTRGADQLNFADGKTSTSFTIMWWVLPCGSFMFILAKVIT